MKAWAEVFRSAITGVDRRRVVLQFDREEHSMTPDAAREMARKLQHAADDADQLTPSKGITVRGFER